MTAPALRVEGLWKAYRIGEGVDVGRTLRETIMDCVQATWHSSRRTRANERDAHAVNPSFWALRDINFEVEPGGVVGIIGHNGAGKSTLLKLLSRITAPSQGEIRVRGRVASLLEVGTGFHPELTGRENIRLNGAILGMTGTEISRKFDEIVAFSGVEDFIDTPVKRYSSGMQVRLAFAVAAHLEPEILVIDEVLAVGDMAFQKKCMGKMDEITGRGGRTVLFVSHQLGMVARLCARAILLSGGRLSFSGPSGEAIDHYIAEGGNKTHRSDPDDPRLRDCPAVITQVDLMGADGVEVNAVAWNAPIRVRTRIALRKPPGGMLLGVAVDNRHGARVTTWVTRIADHTSAGEQNFELELEAAARIIAPGGYSLTVALFEPGTVHHRLEGAAAFVIVDSGSEMAAFGNVDYGVAIIPASWECKAA